MVGAEQGARRRGSLRVLQLIDSLTAGGAEASLVGLVRAMRAGGIPVRVRCLKRIGANPFEEAIRAVGVPVDVLGSRNLRDVGAFLRLTEGIRRDRPDVIHAHLAYAAIWGVAAGRLAGVPVVVTLHTDPAGPDTGRRERLREWLLRALLRRWAAAVVFVSKAIREAWRLRRGLNPDRAFVVRNGVDCDLFAPADPELRKSVREELDLPGDARVVFTASVLREGKGLEVLVRSARAVARQLPDVRFVVAGDGPMREELRQQCDALGLAERFSWLGFRRDVARLYAAADLFVLPTLGDALPTVLLEALASGLPVVATKVGGVPEIVDPPRTGLLVPPAAPAELARAVAALLADPERRAAMGTAGRRRAEAEFSLPAWRNRLMEVYESVLPDAEVDGAPGEVA